MNRQWCNEEKDKRLLVLLSLGAAIIAVGWFWPKPELKSFDYYYNLSSKYQGVPLVARSLKESPSQSGPDFVQISTETSCADTPPQLALFFDLPLPINRANHHSMTMLPGIGNKRAEDIISLRNQQGWISGPDVLTRVDGIGNTIIKRLSPMICLD